MKKIFILLVFFACNQNNLHAQFLFEVAGSATYYFLNSDLNKVEIEGSPYSNDEFMFAKVSGTEKKVKLRYNSHDDVFEMENVDKEIFEVKKNELYSTIFFENTAEKYKLVRLKDEIGDRYGYMLEFFNSEKLKVLKREKSIFIQGQSARNTYDTAIQAKFVKASSEFYWNANNGVYTLFPNSKEKLIESFPTKKYEINKFFREFSPNFNDENGIASISNFCSTLQYD